MFENYDDVYQTHSVLLLETPGKRLTWKYARKPLQELTAGLTLLMVRKKVPLL